MIILFILRFIKKEELNIFKKHSSNICFNFIGYSVMMDFIVSHENPMANEQNKTLNTIT